MAFALIDVSTTALLSSLMREEIDASWVNRCSPAHIPPVSSPTPITGFPDLCDGRKWSPAQIDAHRQAAAHRHGLPLQSILHCPATYFPPTMQDVFGLEPWVCRSPQELRSLLQGVLVPDCDHVGGHGEEGDGKEVCEQCFGKLPAFMYLHRNAVCRNNQGRPTIVAHFILETRSTSRRLLFYTCLHCHAHGLACDLTHRYRVSIVVHDNDVRDNFAGPADCPTLGDAEPGRFKAAQIEYEEAVKEGKRAAMKAKMSAVKKDIRRLQRENKRYQKKLDEVAKKSSKEQRADQ